MADNELPEKVIPLTVLRLNWDSKKKNSCEHGYYEIDPVNKEVACTECGAVVSAYDALWDVARKYDRLQREVQSLLEQRKQILNWKPWLLPMRELERIYRGGDMLPCCPHCGRGIMAGEMTGAVNKNIELERRKFEGKK